MFVVRDRLERIENKKDLEQDLSTVLASLKKRFPDVDSSGFVLIRIVRNPPSDDFDVLNTAGSVKGKMTRKGMNTTFIGVDVSSHELRYGDRTYFIEYGSGVEFKDNFGNQLAAAKIIGLQSKGFLLYRGMEYKYLRFFWGDKAILSNGKLLMYSMAPNIFASKRLLLIDPGMDTDFQAVSVSIAPVY